MPNVENKLTSGQRIAHYEIIRSIGAGGMGEVYLARDTKLTRQVALKFLPAELTNNKERLLRFKREARATSALNHPNILTIYEIGESDGVTFIATEFVDGVTLRHHSKSEDLLVREILDIAIQVASALSTSHEAGIVHRDIKPENVMLRRDGIVKVLDFGLAKTITPTSEPGDEEMPTRLLVKTTPGLIMGTVTYMSPEQARGKEVDARSDIWSFGVVLYEMIARRLPFAGETSSDTIAAILTTDPAPLNQVGSDVPDELQRIVNKTLRKEKNERYHTTEDLLVDLKSLKQELEFVAQRERSYAPETTRDKVGVGEPQTPAPADVNRSQNLEPQATTGADNLIKQLIYRKRVVIGALALFAIAATGLAYIFYFNHKSAALTEQDTILLVDIDNKTGDAVFDGALKQGLAVQLGQSPFLNLFPDTRVRETLKLMNRSPDERVTVPVGLEICERQGLKALIAGSIAPLGSHYVIALEAINGHSGDVIAREQTEAESKEQVLKALSTMASSLREKLGESLSSIQKFDKPLEDTTSSLEALKAYSQGYDIQLRGKFFESMPFFKHAIELDKDFALAYGLLASMYNNTGQKKLAAEYAAKGYALRDRVSEQEKFRLSAQYFRMTTGEIEKVIETLTLYEQTFPRIYNARVLMGASYREIGQWEKAIVADREALALNPNVVHAYVNEARALTALNRFAEAKGVYEQALQLKLETSAIHAGLFQIAFVENDPAIMQEQIDWSHGQPDEYIALYWQAETAAFAGQWHKAHDLLQQAIDVATRSNVKEEAARFASEQALRAAVLGRCDQTRTYVTQSLALERNQVTLSRSALALALCGEAQPAQLLDDDLSKQYSKDTIVKGLWLPTIRAASELHRGNAAKAVELLEEAKRYEPVAEFYPQYIRGMAYLEISKRAEAAAEFQKILDHRGEAPLSVIYSLANLGLARACAMTRDIPRSIKAYQDLLRLWIAADVDLPVLIEAKQELDKSLASDQQR